MLSKLILTNFRNYETAGFEFTNPITVIVGRNGAGKTNVLEAISLLTPGKGIRGATMNEIKKVDATNWAVFGECSGYKVGTGQEIGQAKRTVRIDGEPQRGTNILATYVSAIWLTPQMDGIFLADSGERRRFFDRIIYNFDPEHASRVAVYENAMRERLRLLKDGVNDAIWLKTLEKRMAEYGVAVAAARVEIISYLQTAIDERESLFPKPEINMTGKYEELIKSRSALEVEDIFVSDLANSRYQDADSGRTSQGVHRTDFAVFNKAKNIAAEYSSTGEQKALLLSIVIALGRMLKAYKNRTPIMLLDEVVAHLDEGRRTELFDEIKSLNCQTFLSGTENNFFEPLNAKHFLIENNAVKTL